MLDALETMGVRVACTPRSTFYVWGDISSLPAPYNDAEALFQAGLQQKVMVVPGRFFDVNPGAQRGPDSSYGHWMRFSYGPPEANMRMGFARLQAILR